MCRKLIFLACVVLVLGIVNVASSAEIHWKGPGTEWDVGTNWVGGVVPGPADEAHIEGTITGPTIDSDVNVGHIDGPSGNGQVLTITAGHVVSQNLWSFGSDSGMATINISGSPVIEVLGPGAYGRGWVGTDEGGSTLNISGDPDIYVESGIRGADNIGSVFDFYMSGGDVNCASYMIGDDGSGSFYLTGGTFNCRNEFKISGREGGFFTVQIGGEGSPAELMIGGNFLSPAESDGGAWINLDNGYIECASWGAAGENWILDINEGLLRIKNAPEFYDMGPPPVRYIDQVQHWIDTGQITGYNNTETPQVTTDGTDIVVTVHFVHTKAYEPSPAHKATDICPTDVELSWTPGIYVQDHNIYFGTDDSDVNESATPVEVGWDTNTWPLPGPLEIGTTYYWRVDTVNDVCAPYLWEGGVWRFLTDDGRARDPYPTNGIRGIAYADVDLLSWTPSCVAANHYVYMGMPGSIVLFEDDFEDGFDANWASTTGWSIYNATGDSNFAPQDNNLARAVAGTMTSSDIDASDANSINVSFAIRLAKGAGAGAVTLSYYNGSSYIPVADWNSLDPCDTWLGYGDTITDSQYTEISNFRIRLASTLTGPNSVYINNVRVTNNWPIAAEYYQGQTVDDSNTWPVSVNPWKPYSWRIDTITTGGRKTQGPRWTFQTGLGGLLMYYKFDGVGSFPSVVTDDSGNNVKFDKYTNSGGSVVYGESNPVLVSSTAGAVFDPNAGLHRFDPCAPDEIEPLRLSGYQHTVELWVKPTRLDGDMDIDEDDWMDEDFDICLIGKHNSWGIWIDEPGGDNAYRFMQAGNGETLESDTAKVNEWAHLALVYDQTADDSYQCYLNGLLVDSTNEGMNANDNNYPVTIGYARRDDVNLGRFFEGVIDEVRIHDVALGPCELLISPGPQWPSCPSPQNGEQNVDPCGVVLGWTPGSQATSRKVYFSTDFAEVDTLDPAALIYEGPNTTASLGDLDDGTVYHWRVVELNGGGPWEGPTWSFSTKYLVDDPSLRVWYEFDETSGDDAYDHSGHGFHAEGADGQWDPDGGKWGGCLVFDDDIALTASSNIFATLTSGITVAVWINNQPNWETPQVLFDTGGQSMDHKLQAAVPNEDGDVVWRAGNDSNDLMIWRDATPRAWAGDWHHLAFVKNEGAGTMSIYFDGLLADTKSGVFATLTNIFVVRPFKIGAYGWHDEDYEGSMDDFRIYDRVLTDDQIAALFRGGDLDIAWGPDPYDGRADASPDADLTWYPGNHAAQHKVFFGTTRSEVEEMNDPCATLGIGAEFYDPGPLELDTYYYWRIDEVNGPNTWTGPVWRFKVADFMVLDDFESYNITSDLWLTWYCYYTSPYGVRSGARLTLSKNLVHTGERAMKYEYLTDSAPTWDQDYDYADACLPLDEIDGFQDWTSVDVRVLTIFFYGQAGNDTNDTEQMYTAVHNASGNYAEVRYGDDHPGEDMNDLKVEEWQRWDVPFIWFTDSNAAVSANVDFSAISSVYLGFGNRRDPIPAGKGVVYFDDLRLSMPYCRPEHGPTGDLNGDCVVGIADFGEMTEDWLEHDVNFPDLGIDIEEPCDANLAGHYKLDGDTLDSSGNGYDGTAEGSYYWAEGRIGQYAVGLNGGWVVVEDEGNTPKLRPKHEVSVMAWINRAQHSSDDIKVIIKGRDNHETYGLEINQEDEGLTFLWRDANELDDDEPKKYDLVSEQELPVDEWVHIAGTYDGNEMTSYVNGEVELTSTPGPNELYSDANDGFGIGGRYGDGADFEGEIDDVRVYDYGLSQAEVAWIATQGEGVFPLTSQANFYSGENPEVINFRDFAKLFEYWGDEQLWPPEPAP